MPDAPLTSAQFHILLTLVEGYRHGYGIMQEIENRTGGAVEVGPGTLYRSIKLLLRAGLIVEVQDIPESTRQRRTYALTDEGKARTAEETRRLKDLAKWAEETAVLEANGP